MRELCPTPTRLHSLAGLGLVGVLSLFACARHATAPGAVTPPQEEELSATRESRPGAPDEVPSPAPAPAVAAGDTAAETASHPAEPAAAAPTVAGDDTGGAASDTTLAVIVQAASAEVAANLVIGVGGRVTHRLNIIRAVGAELSQEQYDLLSANEGVSRIWENREVRYQTRP